MTIGTRAAGGDALLSAADLATRTVADALGTGGIAPLALPALGAKVAAATQPGGTCIDAGTAMADLAVPAAGNAISAAALLALAAGRFTCTGDAVEALAIRVACDALPAAAFARFAGNAGDAHAVAAFLAKRIGTAADANAAVTAFAAGAGRNAAFTPADFTFIAVASTRATDIRIAFLACPIAATARSVFAHVAATGAGGLWCLLAGPIHLTDAAWRAGVEATAGACVAGIARATAFRYAAPAELAAGVANVTSVAGIVARAIGLIAALAARAPVDTFAGGRAKLASVAGRDAGARGRIAALAPEVAFRKAAA